MKQSIVLVLLVLVAGSAFGVEEFIVTPEDAERNDYFGMSVAIDGDYAVVGATGDDDNGESSGSAYIIVRNDEGEWNQQAKLIAEDADNEDYFGGSVSISGDYVIVGARGNDDGGNNSGSAYIFVRTGEEWSQQAKLVAQDDAAQDYFGGAVSISGNYAIVGASWDDDIDERSGSAYIFEREDSSWTQKVKLTADNGGRWDYFGESVAISGDYSVIGAPHFRIEGNSIGSAYVFVRNGEEWNQQAQLIADDADDQDLFGTSVSIYGGFAFVGSPNNDDDGDRSGSAYIYFNDGNEWNQQIELTADERRAENYFGTSVSINNTYAIVGALGSSGSAYIFLREDDEWTKWEKLVASDAWQGDSFGKSVSISENFVIAGDYRNNYNGDNAGSTYIYSDLLSGIAEPSVSIPTLFTLSDPYPNPFNGRFKFNINLPQSDIVQLHLYDVTGRAVWSMSERFGVGSHQKSVDINMNSAGPYFLQASSTVGSETKRVVMLK